MIELARHGAKNGHARLTDDEVRAVRRLCLSGHRTQAIADMYQVSVRQVQRIVYGSARIHAGGEIAERRRQVDVDPQAPFDESTRIRCRGCGAMAHASRDRGDLCFACVLKGVIVEPLRRWWEFVLF